MHGVAFDVETVVMHLSFNYTLARAAKQALLYFGSWHGWHGSLSAAFDAMHSGGYQRCV